MSISSFSFQIAGKQQIVLEPAQTPQAFNLCEVEQDTNVSFTISFIELQFLITSAQFSVRDVTGKSYQGTQVQLVPQRGSVPRPPLGHNLSLTKGTARTVTNTTGVSRFSILLCHNHTIYHSLSVLWFQAFDPS